MSSSIGGLVGSIGNATYDLGNAWIALTDPNVSASDAQAAVASAANAVANLGTEAISAFSANGGYLAAGLAAPLNVTNFAFNVYQAQEAIESWNDGNADINQVFQAALGVVGAFGGLVQNYGQLGGNPAVVFLGVGIQTYANAVKELNKWAAAGYPGLSDWLTGGMSWADIFPGPNFLVPRRFRDSKKWTYPRDPLTLDLDADGLETVAPTAGLHYDHDADGIQTGTGWLKGDDAFLVRDVNGNGVIDTGRELFGDNTLLPGGGTAANGFAALAALDTNADGFIDASDAAFAELKLWQDLNQDGISQANELKTLIEAGIASLNVAATLKNQSLGNGNVLAREGFFTRVDGTTGKAGELNLAIDTFDTRFTDSIEVAEPVKALPNMAGSGKVRELWQAASQSGTLQSLLAQFAAAPTREAQRALLDPILGAWADTSGMIATLDDRDPAHTRIEYVAFGSLRRSDHLNKIAVDAGGGNGGGSEIGLAGLRNTDDPRLDATYKAAIQNWNRKLHILEAFNGQYFFNFPGERNETPGANVGLRKLDGWHVNYYQLSADALGQQRQTLAIEFAQQQLDLLDEALAALKDSVYGALVLQTRVKPLLDLVELVIDEQGIRLNATALNTEIARRIEADPVHGLSDLLDLDRYAADLLTGSNWDGLAGFDSLIQSLPPSAELSALLNDYQVRRLGAGNDGSYNGDRNDIVLGGNGNDYLYGNAGNDLNGAANTSEWRVVA